MKWSALLGVVGALSCVTRSARAQTYYIDEMTDWTGNGCEAEDVPAVTGTFRGILDQNGWSGPRYLNANAWPQDMMESCNGSLYGAGGIDDSQADASDLLVVSGHGNIGFVAFAYQRSGICTVDLGKTGKLSERGRARLGQMGGARTSMAIYLTCCTLKKDMLAARANYQWVKQQLGFGNLSGFDSGMVSAYGRNSGAPTRTGYISNVEAWLTAMEDEPGWFTGDNSPIVVSYGNTSAQANSNHANLSLGEVQSPRTGGPACGAGLPRFYYQYTIRDHGSAGCM